MCESCVEGCHRLSIQVLSVRAQMRGVHVTLRMRLECRIVRQGSKGHAGLEEVYEVLNEVVVDRGANPFLTKIECWERDRLITKARRPVCFTPCSSVESALLSAASCCDGRAGAQAI